jgi:hypothetical protein
MTSERTTWDRLGAYAGICAVLALGVGYAIAFTTRADLHSADADYARAILGERMKWEWVTFVRLAGGTLILWFMGTLSGRLRLAEGEPGRLASAGFGLGVVWAGVWLLSGFFNSAAIRFAADYQDATGSRIAGVLAQEAPYALTGCIGCALVLATAFIAFRSGRFPKSYAYITAALAPMFLVLALADWYGGTSLGPVIVGLALLWTAATSGVLISRGTS